MKSTKERNFADYLTSNYGGAKSSAPEIPQVEKVQPQKQASDVPQLDLATGLTNLLSPKFWSDQRQKAKAKKAKPQTNGYDFSPAAQNAEIAKYIQQNNPELPVLNTREISALDTSPVLYEGKAGGQNFKVTENTLNRWTAPDTVLTDTEKRQARAYYNSEMPKRYLEQFTDLFKDKETQAAHVEKGMKLNTLWQKFSPVGNAMRGALDSVPGGEKLLDALGDATDKIHGIDTQELRDSASQAAKDSGLPYIAGKAAGKMGQYLAVNASGIMAPVANAIGGVLGSHVGNILADEVVDIALDTVPEMFANINSGMSGQEVATEVLKNLGVNLAFNAGGEVIASIPQIKQALKTKTGGKISDEAAEAFAKNLNEISDDIAKNLPVDNAVKQADEVIDSVKPVEAPEIPAVKPNLPDTETIAKQAENLTPDGLKLLDGENYGYALMETPMPDGTIGYTPTIHLYDSGETIPITPLKSYATEEDAIKAINDFKAPKVDDIAKQTENLQTEVDNVLKGQNNVQMTIDDLVDSTVPTAKTTVLEAFEDVVKDIKKDASFGEYISGIRRSFNGKVNYLKDWQNEYATAFKSALNTFQKSPTPRNYEELLKSFDEYAANAGTRGMKNWRGDWYVKEFDGSGLRKNLEQIGEKYNLNQSARIATNSVDDATDVVKDLPEFKTTEPAQHREIPDMRSYEDQWGPIAPYDEPIKEIPKVEKPVANKVNNPSSQAISGPDTDVSRYAGQTIQKTDMPDELKEVFAENPPVYKILHNSNTDAAARQILEGNDFNTALMRYNDLLAAKDPVAIPLGYDLAQQMIKDGNLDGATELIEGMSRELTKSGQFTQAAAIRMMQSNPMASMRLMEKQIQKINETGAKKFGKKWVDFALTDAEKNAFANIKNGDTEAIEKLFTDITMRIADEYPATTWEKIVEASKTAMMLNPRTHIRNVLANTAMFPVRSLSDRVSALGQNAVHLFNKDFDVTQSLLGGTREQKKLAGQIFDEKIKPLLEGQNKYSEVTDNILRNRQVFKDSKIGEAAKEGVLKTVGFLNTISDGKFGKLLETLDDSMTGSLLENLRRFDYHLLGAVEDDPFVKANFVNRLASYMKAQGINTLDAVPNDAIQTAYAEALKATFKDNNYLTKAFSGIKKALGKPLGEVALPFVKTPANIAKRAIEYSPAGFIDTLVAMKKGDIKGIPEIMDALAKNATGTAGIALGYALADKGLIQGALSSNKRQKEFQKQQGKQAFSINIGGDSYTFEWMQPAAIPIIIGTVIHDAVKDSDNILNTLKQGTIAAGDTFLSLSPVQSLQEMLGGNGYGGSATENLMNTIAETPLRLIPSLFGATARTIDPVQRETYSSGNPLQTWIDKAKSKIPALGDDDNWWNQNISSKSLPETYDTWGNVVIRQDTNGEAAFANYINPGTISNNATTPIDDEINRLYESTNSVSVFPNAADRTFDGKKLTNKEHSDYQRVMGQASYDMAETLIDSDGYQNLSDEQRQKCLTDIYSAAKSMAETELFGKKESTDKLIEAYKQGGPESAVDYLLSKYSIKQSNISSSDKNAQEAYAEGGQEGLDNYVGVTTDETKASQQSIADKYPSFDASQIQNGTSKNVDVDKAIPYLRDLGVNDFAEMGEILYNNATRSVNAISAYNNLGGYAGVGLYYAMQADAKGLNPGGSDKSLDKQEIAQYLDSLGYDLAGINKVYEALGKNAISEKDYAKYLGKSSTETKKSSSKSTTSSSEFDSSFLRQYSNQQSGLSSDFLRSYGK